MFYKREHHVLYSEINDRIGLITGCKLNQNFAKSNSVFLFRISKGPNELTLLRSRHQMR